jgi:Protein of unknown function (DUF3179)
VWTAAVGGRRLKFHLAGINNENFLMQDEETGSWWQQVTGEAIHGPLRGRHLEPVFTHEISFALWRREQPGGRVLRSAAGPGPSAVPADWEDVVGHYPVVGPLAAPAKAAPLPPRALVVGLTLNGAAKAYPFALLLRASPLLDLVGSVPIALLVGEDGRSVRAFETRLDGRRLHLFAPAGAAPAPRNQPAQWFDAETGSVWDFTGKATGGALAGRRLPPVPVRKEYWFNWRTYHPATGVYTTLPGKI